MLLVKNEMSNTEQIFKVVDGKKVEKLTKDGKLKETPNNTKVNRDYILPYKEDDVDKMVEWLDRRIECACNEEDESIRRRNKAIFLVGCNCGLRVSDLCQLTWDDIFNEYEKLRDSKIITPKKTKRKGVHVEVQFTDAFKIAIVEYIEGNKIAINHDFVREAIKLQKRVDVLMRNLKTMKSNKCGKYSTEEIMLKETELENIHVKYEKLVEKLYVFPSRQGGHISDAAIDKMIKDGKKAVGISYPVATHSLRKTWARIKYDHAENKTEAAKYLQAMFGHSSEAVTMIYIGIRQEELRDFCNETNIGIDVEEKKSILGKYM